jgi:hypothetical protein
MTTTDWSQWDGLKYRRRLETFGTDDVPLIATGPNGEFDGVWCVIHSTTYLNDMIDYLMLGTVNLES